MKRRRLLALLSLAPPGLSGCGFEPLYGRQADTPITDAFARIRIQPIANRSGQILRNHLYDRLQPRGEIGPIAYTLSVRLDEPLPQDLGITRTDTVVRFSYSATADARLVDAAGREVWRGRSTSSTNYEVSASQFATMAGQNNARERVLEEIANDIKAQLAAVLRARPPAPG